MRGGKRAGAGRPKGSGKYSEPTVALRLPQSLAQDVQRLLTHPLTASQIDLAQSQLEALGQPQIDKPCLLPMLLEHAAAGFPSPAAQYCEGQIDLNDILIPHPAATFLMRVVGDSMIEAGILPGATLIVDRSLTPRDGDVVVAVLYGSELTVKRLSQNGRRAYLLPANSRYPTTEITEAMDLCLWGVVTHTINHFR